MSAETPDVLALVNAAFAAGTIAENCRASTCPLCSAQMKSDMVDGPTRVDYDTRSNLCTYTCKPCKLKVTCEWWDSWLSDPSVVHKGVALT